MLKSCKYCGRIHESSFICSKKKEAIAKRQKKQDSKINKFRWSKAWQRKRAEIRERDNQVCQVCVRKLHGYIRQFETDNLSVHHIVPLEVDFNKRMDNENLITLCSMHHEMAEKGDITASELLDIAEYQESKNACL